MHRIAILFSLALIACGTQPEDATVEQAVSGHSYFAPGTDLGAQDWLWQSGWNPLTASWPSHGWGRWSPPPFEHNKEFYRVSTCGTWAAMPGSLDISDGVNFPAGANCARLWGSVGQANSPGYEFDSDFVQAAGWLSYTSGVLSTSIRSMTVGPHTSVALCEAPFTGPSGTCAVRAIGIWNGSNTAITYPTVTYSDGTAFITAAIMVWGANGT